LKVEFRLLVFTMQILPGSSFMASWLPQAYTRLWAASAVAQLWQHVRSESDLKEFTPTVRAL
jgi:hypothetical protein